ncbi:hypothetical protein BJH93_12890 [Kocuria polaris]|nr:hypothetical protein [Kocuria polaris]
MSTADVAARTAIATVTPNPALDLSYTVPGITPGQTHRVGAPLVRAGGKGVNVARVAAQAGHRAIVLAPVGGATGDEFLTQLRGSQVEARTVATSVPTRRTMGFHDTADGATSIFNEPGGELPASVWDEFAVRVDAALGEADCLVGSGSLPAGADAGFYADLAIRASRRGIPCVVDTSGPALVRAAAAGPTALKPNEHELRAATGRTDLDAAAVVLLDAGVRHVFVSCGEAGMRLYSAPDPGAVWVARLDAVLAGNPTGAGDAAVAAIATLLAAGHEDPRELVGRASAWAAAAVLMPGAGEIHPTHPQLLARTSIERLPLPDATKADS